VVECYSVVEQAEFKVGESTALNALGDFLEASDQVVGGISYQASRVSVIKPCFVYWSVALRDY
jgi:hypothetical protein